MIHSLLLSARFSRPARLQLAVKRVEAAVPYLVVPPGSIEPDVVIIGRTVDGAAVELFAGRTVLAMAVDFFLINLMDDGNFVAVEIGRASCRERV